jgi:putative IMPACT (imprinted ancient) family translation regulator
MKRNDIVNKINAAERKLEELNEERKKTRESVSAYKMLLEMSDNGQLEIFDDEEEPKTNTRTRK